MYEYDDLAQMVRAAVPECDPNRAQSLAVVVSGQIAGHVEPPFDEETGARIVAESIAVYQRNTEPRVTLDKIAADLDSAVQCGHATAITLLVGAGICHGLLKDDADGAQLVTAPDAHLLTQCVMFDYAEIHGGAW